MGRPGLGHIGWDRTPQRPPPPRPGGPPAPQTPRTGGTAGGPPGTASPGAGVAFSDALGATFDGVTTLDVPTMAPAAVGRISMAQAAATNRVYVVCDRVAVGGNDAALFHIPDVMARPPV